MPSADALFGSSKRVFAHYFAPFPVSIDNQPATKDYYNDQYLAADGESNKWKQEGGFLRQRPLGVTPGAAASWQQQNMAAEVRAAIARGITGFTFDALTVGEAADNETSHLHLLMAAAQSVDSRFKIIVMPDITELGSDSASVVKIIASVASSPAAYHLSDGRLVVSAFDAGANSAGWWQTVLNELSSQGIKVAFVPTFLAWPTNIASFEAISYGFGDWGTATSASAATLQGSSATVQNTYKKAYMMPVNSQQYRAKDFLFWEAGNSGSFRAGWTSAIQADTDWIQLVTWSDFSESGEIAPYTDATLKRDIGTGYYDLNGYYASWFLTGKEPTITHDVLYYFYRREPTTAAAKAQIKKATAAAGTGAATDEIELLAFLTAPGVVKITVGGKTYSQSASAGLTSFKIPSQPGIPLFTLSRANADVFSFQGGVQIYGAGGLPSGVQDLTYWSGSASKTGICSL
jgi:Glycosyl hydrolase family 71